LFVPGWLLAWLLLAGCFSRALSEKDQSVTTRLFLTNNDVTNRQDRTMSKYQISRIPPIRESKSNRSTKDHWRSNSVQLFEFSRLCGFVCLGDKATAVRGAPVRLLPARVKYSPSGCLRLVGERGWRVPCDTTG